MPQKEQILQIPEWMTNQTEYTPITDKDGFISKSILNLLRLFRHFHIVKNENMTRLRAGFRTLLILGLIIMNSLSQNLFFCGSIAAGFLFYLSFSKIDILKRVLSVSLAASFFTALIMLPSFVLYKSNSLITITFKVFLSTGIISLYAQITPWNKITSALSFAKIPGFLIFLLDLTVHYILILGNAAYEMFFALQLRSIGKNQKKQKSFSGILGTLFLKSVAVTQETQQAMECRLFDGVYDYSKSKITVKDFLPLFVLILYIVLFIFVS